MKIRSKLFLCLLAGIASVGECANILGIFPYYSKSHSSFHQIILENLATRGHNVTVFSFFGSTKTTPNHKGINIGKPTHSLVDSYTVDVAYRYGRMVSNAKDGQQLEFSSCRQIFDLPHIKEAVQKKNNKLYDVLVGEMNYIRCCNLLGHELDIPTILFYPTTTWTFLDHMIGNPCNPAVVPLVTSSYYTRMTFFERVTNTVQYATLYAFYHYFVHDEMADICKNYFHTTLPATESLHRQVALIFYNNHFSLINRPLAPNAIDIGGIHIQQSIPLPQDIQEFIDGAKNGVIFFSFGTTIKASSIHPKKLQALKEVFSTIPQRVIWRTNELNLTDLPDNVKVGHWFPQRDILEHKNVRAFISHCGIFGTQEAIYTATPVIAIPFLFDQFQNARILVERGVAVLLDYDTMDKDNLRTAIHQILHDKKYQDNMQKLSNIFKDRPMSPLDTAIYWTEYVIRHNGAPHLRVTGADMPLYQYLLLDVVAFLLVIIGCALYSLKYAISKIISYFSKDKVKFKKT